MKTRHRFHRVSCLLKVKADGTLVNIWTDSKRVGHNISTKSVGSDKRNNITDSYKHREGEWGG